MWIAVISGIVVLVGLCVLASGLRAKRVGSEPHCRRCEYNLTGSVSRTHCELLSQTPSALINLPTRERESSGGEPDAQHAPCPECGTPVSRSSVKWGEKRRRVAMPMAGLFIIAIGATGLYANWNPRGWVRRYPFPALLVMAKFGNVSVVAELQRRYLKSDLSPRQEQRLVETALDKQNSLPVGFELREWLDLLVQLKQGGSLSEEQIDQYWAQAFHDAELVPRRRYRVGEQLVVGLVVDFRMEVENARIANERARSELLEKNI